MFDVEPGNGNKHDTFLADNDIETFFIVNNSTPNQLSKSGSCNLIRSVASQILHPALLVEKTTRMQTYSPFLKGDDWKPEIPFSNVRLAIEPKE